MQIVKRRQGGETAQLKANLQSLDKRDGEQQLSVYKLKAENQQTQERYAEIDRKHKELLKSNSHTLSLLDQLKNKYEMQKDLNQMYRRFYAKNVVDQMNKGDFEHNIDSMFKDFNTAMASKDNFIAESMDGLEQLVDKSSMIKTESMR